MRFTVLKCENYFVTEAEQAGEVFSTANTLARYGYTWRSTAGGAVSVLTNDKGQQLSIPKKLMIDRGICNL